LGARPGTVRLRGWTIDNGYSTHTVVMGPDVPGLEQPRDVYLDGKPLARIPYVLTKPWQHEFRIDGEAAVVKATIVGGRRGKLQFFLRMGDADPQPVGHVDVPAAVGERLAAATGPAARLGLVALALLGVGFGLIVPTYRPHVGGRDPAVVGMLTFGLGLLALAAFLWARLRGRPPGWSATALFWVAPFDLGTLAGVALAKALGVGTETGPTDIVETGLVYAMALVVLAIATLWVAYARPGRSPELGPMQRLGSMIGSLGCATIGLAILAAALGLFGATIHNAGVTGLIALVGAVVLAVGLVVAWIGIRRARASSTPTGTGRHV
jgi:hypothetical protein